MPQYQTGTVDTTNGETIITGHGTLWSANINVGDAFSVRGENAIYSVGAVDSNTQITLTSAYAGSDSTSVNYQITTDFTTNFSFAELWAGDRDYPYHITVGFIRALDSLLGYQFQGLLSKDVSGSSNVTLSATECKNKILEFTGTLTGNIDVIVPSTYYRNYIVYNGTSGAYTLTVKVSGQTGVEVTQGKRMIGYINGTDFVRVTSDT